MAIEKKEAFMKQIAVYLKNGDKNKALDLAKDFAAKFPNECLAHYLLAHTALDNNDSILAKTEARKAFNLAKSEGDMLSCALLSASAYFATNEISKGYDILITMEKKVKSAELENALVIFSMALDRPKEALDHYNKLFELNKKLALSYVNGIAKK